MKQKASQQLPSPLEYWAIAFVSVMILLLGNGHDLLQRYGLIQSSQLVKDQLSHGVGNGLGKLDTYSATTGIVSFAIWGCVGLIAFSIVQALLRISAHRKYEHELSTNHYVHPAGFNPDAFWKSIILHAVASFVLLGLSVTGLLFYTLEIIPISFEHARLFLLNPSILRLWQLVIGMALLFVSSLVLYTIAKITLQHHRFAQV